MNNIENFIDYTKNPLLAQLSTSFVALLTVKNSIDSCLEEVKNRNGERLGNRFNQDRADLKARQRERNYEVAVLRLELANSELRSLARTLHEATAAVREALATQKNYELVGFGVECGVAQNNVISGMELVDEALRLHHVVVYKHLHPSRWHYFGIERSFKALDESEDPREFVVMYSGHGSSYRFEGEDPNTPPPGPYLTLSEAREQVSHWVGYADTIGGDAVVYNVRTKKELPWRG